MLKFTVNIQKMSCRTYNVTSNSAHSMNVSTLICRESFRQCCGSVKVVTFILSFHEKVNLSLDWQEVKKDMGFSLQEYGLYYLLIGREVYLPSSVD